MSRDFDKTSLKRGADNTLWEDLEA